jgi:hypothetical protein
MNVNLHIERLILDGLPIEAGHRAVLQSEIETELARLLTDNGVAENWQNGGAVPRVSANAIQMTAQSNPAEVGRQIAGSIYGSIGKTT